MIIYQTSSLLNVFFKLDKSASRDPKFESVPEPIFEINEKKTFTIFQRYLYNDWL